MINVINTEHAPAAIGPYSQAIIYRDTVYTSGQIPVDPVTGKIVEGGIEEQAEQVMKNLKAVLEAAGSKMSLVIKTTCFIQNMEDFAVFNKVYEKYFVSKPARSCVEAARLPKDVLVEIEAVAATE